MYGEEYIMNEDDAIFSRGEKERKRGRDVRNGLM
jgi:hypothetical protein